MTHDPYRDVTWTPGPPPVPVDLDAVTGARPTPDGRGICSGCGLERALRRDGTVRLHHPPRETWGYAGQCPGVGEAPKGRRQ